jgi:predicted HicB family RNase H-like nuclease
MRDLNLGWPTGPEFDDARPAKTIEEVRRHYSDEFNARFDERLTKARAARVKREG